jgi:hypothetical protein
MNRLLSVPGHNGCGKVSCFLAPRSCFEPQTRLLLKKGSLGCKNYNDPMWSDPSLDPAQSGSFMHRVTLFYIN